MAATSPVTPRVDGRHASRDRNLNAVVDALLDLFAEGNLRPGAEEIATRSGVSRRSVFRYFDDLDALDRVAIDRQFARVGHLIEVPDLGQGDLPGRIERIIAQRIRLFDAVAPVARVSRLRAPFERVVAEELQNSRRVMRRQVERNFEPELSALLRAERTAVLNAAAAAVSFETYDLLRSGHAATSKQVADSMRCTLTAVFAHTQ